MSKKISKVQAKEEINQFFSNLKSKTPKDVKKLRKLAMKHNIKLGDKKKLFCKKCLTPHVNLSISLKKGFVNIICGNCKYVSKWKIKTF